LSDGKNNDAPSVVAKLLIRETQITGKHSWMRQSEKKWKDLLVRHSLLSNIHSDLTDRNSPAAQQLPLAFEDVFVKDVHILSFLYGQFVRVFFKRSARQPHRFRNGFFANTPAPFLNDAFPRHTRSDLFKDISDKNPRAAKSGLSMADLFIRHNKPANHFFAHSPKV